MKTLKLDHLYAKQVIEGSKTSTWRIDDDKDIKVNDEINLIDKVNPKIPSSWHSIGIARVDVITEKRLGSISDSELAIDDSFKSKDSMLKYFKGRYGTQVTFDTPVKMVMFTLLSHANISDPQVRPPHVKEAKLYADGGSRGNPGPSASGYAIIDMEGTVIVKRGIYLGLTTNNQAEYQALKLGLEEAHSMGISIINVYMDSLLVVNQMLGIFKVKNRDLWPIHDSVKQLLPAFSKVEFTHVPRELNKIADAAVNEALDEAATKVL
jgi:ribonuclease HI